MNYSMRTLLAFVAGAFVLSACNDDELAVQNAPVQEETQTPTLKHLVFNAIQEGDEAISKASIENSNSIVWNAGDKISVLDGSDINFGNQCFTLTSGANSTTGVFEGEAVETSIYYAVYPYVESYSGPVTEAEALEAVGGDSDLLGFLQSMWYVDEDWLRYYITSDEGISAENCEVIMNYLKGETVKKGPFLKSDGNIENVVIPAVQNAVAGSADPATMLMIAKSTDKFDFEFKNVCAYIKVTPQFDCSAIAIICESDCALAGTVTIDYNDGEPRLVSTDNSSNQVILKGDIKAGNSYYIAVCPTTVSGGFRIEFLNSAKSHYYNRESTKDLVLTRSKVINMGEFAQDGKWSYSSDVSGNDGDGHSWELVAPNLKIATETASNTEKDIDDAKGLWGNDWELLTVDDISLLPVTDFDNYLSLSPLGVLSLIESPVMVTNLNSDGFIWISDIEYNYYNFTNLFFGTDVFFDISVLYKYVR